MAGRVELRRQTDGGGDGLGLQLGRHEHVFGHAVAAASGQHVSGLGSGPLQDVAIATSAGIGLAFSFLLLPLGRRSDDDDGHGRML